MENLYDPKPAPERGCFGDFFPHSEKELDYGEQLAYQSVEDYEKFLGFKVNDAFRIGFEMARIKNKQLGII